LLRIGIYVIYCIASGTFKLHFTRRSSVSLQRETHGREIISYRKVSESNIPVVLLCCGVAYRNI